MSGESKCEANRFPSTDDEQPLEKKTNENVHRSHRERIRERYIRVGMDGLEDHVKLELLLFYAMPRKDTNPVAHALLNRFGSLSGVFDADIEALEKVDGVGRNTAVFLNMIPSLTRTYLEDKYRKGVRFCDNESVAKYLATRYIDRRVETLSVLALDSKSRLLYSEIVNEGSIDTVPIYTRRIVEIAVRPDVASIILAHNHPSGNTMFSREDYIATREIYRALNVIGVELMDHFLLVDEDYASMRSVGLLDQIVSEIQENQ